MKQLKELFSFKSLFTGRSELNLKVTKVTMLSKNDAGPSHAMVRLNNSNIGSDKNKFGRLKPLLITNMDSGSWTIRYVRGQSNETQQLSKNMAAIDYDAAAEIGVSYRGDVNIVITEAKLIYSVIWLWTASNLNVRLSFRLGLLGFIFGVLSLI
ncbi:hypothetical protein A1QO_06220 [Vibrio genomosp. F10 str. ZF-129]|uniref:Uncharacterized protein n=1 Tax=Vibrio genomosp. F10 str. ZF-129 TaxID=1187848 RepID=A0A1E5BG28_9VIBR|nr:hypothetical protein [Vibrio genomosp. F10]OEE34977.1 hypothetical protein A1QO_06220 [Vibrio genomosp. F10 str. ZF-129]